MDNRPHSRQKKVVDKAIKVEKKRIDTPNNNTTNVLKSLFSKLIKK